MQKFIGFGFTDHTGHSMEFQISKWFKKEKTWFSIYSPAWEKQ